MNTKAFVVRHHIRASVDWADSNPNMDSDGREMNHWKVILRRETKQMTVSFSTGLGIQGQPSAADVLDCLASDAGGVWYSQSFEDWANELGFDTDSRKAEHTYRIVLRQSKRLQQFLGVELHRQLIEETERL